MQEQLRHRLEELKKEYEIGQTRLRELEMQRVNLQQTLLRISGAIQVLGEMLEGSSLPPEHGKGLPVEATPASSNGPATSAA